MVVDGGKTMTNREGESKEEDDTDGSKRSLG